MGVNLKDIISQEPLNFEDLKGKVIAIDALNSLYQFLASDRVISHLSGLLYSIL